MVYSENFGPQLQREAQLAVFDVADWTKKAQRLDYDYLKAVRNKAPAATLSRSKDKLAEHMRKYPAREFDMARGYIPLPEETFDFDTINDMLVATRNVRVGAERSVADRSPALAPLSFASRRGMSEASAASINNIGASFGVFNGFGGVEQKNAKRRCGIKSTARKRPERVKKRARKRRH